MRRRDIVEYRTARQMGTIAKRLGLSYHILNLGGADGIPAKKVEIEIITTNSQEMDEFDRAMARATEADVLEPLGISPEMYVASLELCKQLYGLSEWRDQYFEWVVNRVESTITIVRDWNRDGASVVIDPNDAYYPAYDLGYLLRKLPPMFNLYPDTIGEQFFPLILEAGGDYWEVCYGNTTDPYMGLLAEANTPEDATCKLAIELFKQGVLKQEG